MPVIKLTLRKPCNFFHYFTSRPPLTRVVRWILLREIFFFFLYNYKIKLIDTALSEKNYIVTKKKLEMK